MANYTRKRPDITPEMVVSRYRGGLTLHEIAAELECSSRTVLSRLQKAQEPRAPQGGTKRYPVLPQAEINKRRRAREKRWREQHPQRVAVYEKARYQIRKALEQGILVRPEVCENCGIPAKEPPQAAHDDYTQPLDVRWLCRNCHMIWDHDRPKTTRFERKELEAR
jgi:hypothetical protein